jgi:TonB family protein
MICCLWRIQFSNGNAAGATTINTMKTILFFVSLLITSSYCVGQAEMGKKYFDAFWRPVKNQKEAAYYRIAKKVDGNYLVQNYYMSGQLQMEALCSSIDPKITTIGKTKLYYESGATKQEGAFVDDQPIGFHKYYTEDGKVNREIIHREEKRKYVAYYNKEGTNVLVNGSGNIVEEKPNCTEHFEFLDSIIVRSYTTYPNSQDTLYGVVDQRAQYKGGDKKMVKDLQANLQYPASARRKGIEGKVYVEFVVTKEGKTNKMRILKGLSPDCDNAAYFAVAKLNVWEPALSRRRPVSTLFVLPVTFQLIR